MLTIIRLSDVNGEPLLKKDLPSLLRVGDPIALRFRLTRKTGGRTEVLEVRAGKFRVVSVGIDATSPVPKQLLGVESVGSPVPPKWVSVKTTFQGRRLGPSRAPRTAI